MRKWTRAVIVTAALAIAVLSAACSPDEANAFVSVNSFRDANHVPMLGWNESVYAKAVAWSSHMADEGTLSHSTLSDGVPAGWTHLGENVAYASSVEGAMAALEASPPHRANLLNPVFTTAAIGIVQRDGRFWVTEVFVG
jgi:uncharacterized protein YkwD